MDRIVPWPSQLEIADKAISIIKEHAIVYLAMEERTGKSLTAILVAEEINVKKVLIITKLGTDNAVIKGWENTINNYIHLCGYTVINYHSLNKIKGDFDLIILDEPHAYISGFPKKSKLWKDVYKFTKDKPIIYCSATPYAQGIQLLYHQLALSSWSPWSKFKDFYEWFKHFAIRDKAGHIKMIYIGPNRQAVDYKAVDLDKAYETVKHLFITKTREELGFEHEPEDVLHFIELTETTRTVYNTLMSDGVLEFTHSVSGRDYIIVCDTPIKLRWTLHMLEGGGLKFTKSVKNAKGKIFEQPEYVTISNTEKIDFILKTWGDTDEIVIMYQYKVEKLKLEAVFKNARLLQSQSNAEGVDLSMYKHLIIYSQNFSTSQHTQRRARQANKLRAEPIKVHYLLVKNAISHQVYKTCSVNKVNFVDSVFERIEL